MKMRKTLSMFVCLLMVAAVFAAVTVLGNVVGHEETEIGVPEKVVGENEREKGSSSTTIHLVKDPHQIDGTAYTFVTTEPKGDGNQETKESMVTGENIDIVFLSLLVVAILTTCLIHFKLKEKRTKFIKKQGLLLIILMIFAVFVTVPMNVSANSPPVADAGPDQNAVVGEIVQLSGSAYDPDGDEILLWNWSIDFRPNGSTAIFSDSTVPNPTFTPDKDGQYGLTLMVWDGIDWSGPSTMSLTVAPNLPPVADAGPDQSAVVGETVTLSGSAYDPEGFEIVSWTWTIESAPAGSTATISAPIDPEVAEFIPDVDGTYIISLVVNDGWQDSAPDTATVTVAPIPTYVWVDDDFDSSTPGWDYDHFDSVQNGVNAVDTSGTVYVYAGIYYEQVVIPKALTLEGENNETTILDGTGLGTLSKGIYLEGQSGVTLQNLKIQGFEDGIYSCLYSDGNTISGNILSGNINRGLLLYDSDSNTITMNTISGSTKGISLIRSWSNTISGNTASGNKHGIYSFRCYNLISGNTLLYNILNGIYLDEGGHRTITGNTLSYNANGIKLYKSKSNLISENTVSDNQFYGITLQSSMSNTVSGNTVTGNKYGLELSSSDSTILNGNTVSSNLHGIDLWYSDSCLITENAVSDNYYGIRLHTSSSNTLRSNIMTNNVNNFGVDGSYTDHLPLSAYIQDIDTSNTVDGKPIYYWVGHSDETIPLDAGYVGIVDSENIMVEDLTLTNNHQGVLIANSNACAIQNVVVSGNYIGILLCSSETNTISDNLVLDNIGGIILSYSSSNTISGNTVSGNDMGIYLSFYSNSNTISENTISGSKYGIHLYSSSSNTISGNTVSQSHHWCIDLSRSDTNTICENIVSGGDYGIRMSSSSSNLIYHNNIIDNLEQAYDDNPENNDWHHPEWLEGNYWSDYTGEDTGGMEYPWDTTEKHLIADDGIGDTEVPHPGVNYDYYPLMEPWESNQPPVITSLTGPIDPIAVNTEFGMLGTFEDPDSEDTHTAIWDWGDDSTSDGTVNELEGTVSGSYAYLTPGVYTITLTVEDAAGESDTATYELYVVIYDPTGAFVTGAGMINSPLGAFPKDPTLTGKAGFGFVSKYQTGALVPDGNTQFRFQAGDIKFQSDSYDWLVVAGPKAMFKGTGTINGEGNYGFLLSAIDADLTPSTDVDLFRIKIWDKDNDDAIEYDNGLGAPDDADPETQVTHGSIKIHKA